MLILHAQNSINVFTFILCQHQCYCKEVLNTDMEIQKKVLYEDISLLLKEFLSAMIYDLIIQFFKKACIASLVVIA